MSLAHRIIPCLDTDGARVVKGVHFVGLRDAGDPVELAARYNSEGADELVVLDIAASRDNRPTFLETIRRVAEQLGRRDLGAEGLGPRHLSQDAPRPTLHPRRHRAGIQRLRPRPRLAPSSRFSRTVSVGKMSRFSGT